MGSPEASDGDERMLGVPGKDVLEKLYIDSLRVVVLPWCRAQVSAEINAGKSNQLRCTRNINARGLRVSPPCYSNLNQWCKIFSLPIQAAVQSTARHPALASTCSAAVQNDQI